MTYAGKTYACLVVANRAPSFIMHFADPPVDIPPGNIGVTFFDEPLRTVVGSYAVTGTFTFNSNEFTDCPPGATVTVTAVPSHVMGTYSGHFCGSGNETADITGTFDL